jgi:cytochrome c oxidase subunit 3
MSASAAEQTAFTTTIQRKRADQFGMFVFLASEIMLFGGLFAAMAAYRILHPSAAGEAASHLNLWLGTLNTAILLTSSMLVALAVTLAGAGKREPVAALLAISAVLGLAFLAIKGCEYRAEYLDGLMPGIGPASPLGERPATLFISLYFVSTALHAVHVAIGVALLAGAAAGVANKRLALPSKVATIELVGLYWHLVDVIWVFLFPLLYLARP